MQQYRFIVNMTPEREGVFNQVGIQFDAKDWFSMAKNIEFYSLDDTYRNILMYQLSGACKRYGRCFNIKYFDASELYEVLTCEFPEYSFTVVGEMPENPIRPEEPPLDDPWWAKY